MNNDRRTGTWRNVRFVRWFAGSPKRIAEGAAAAVLGTVALVLFGLGLNPFDSEEAPPPVESVQPTSAECLVKLSGEYFPGEVEDAFFALSDEVEHFAALWQSDPSAAEDASASFLDTLRFRAWKIREIALVITPWDVEFAKEIYNTAMSAVEAADLLQFDTTNRDGILDALAELSNNYSYLALRIDRGCLR